MSGKEDEGGLLFRRVELAFVRFNKQEKCRKLAKGGLTHVFYDFFLGFFLTGYLRGFSKFIGYLSF